MFKLKFEKSHTESNQRESACKSLCPHLCSYLWCDRLAVPARRCHGSVMSDSKVVRWGTQITPSTLSSVSETANSASSCVDNIGEIDVCLSLTNWTVRRCIPRQSNAALPAESFRTFWSAAAGAWLTIGWRLLQKVNCLKTTKKEKKTNESWHVLFNTRRTRSKCFFDKITSHRATM